MAVGHCRFCGIQVGPWSSPIGATSSWGSKQTCVDCYRAGRRPPDYSLWRITKWVARYVLSGLKSGISELRHLAESSGWKPGPVAQYVADHLKILQWAVIGAAFVLLLLVKFTHVAVFVVLALIALGVLEFMDRAVC